MADMFFPDDLDDPASLENMKNLVGLGGARKVVQKDRLVIQPFKGEEFGYRHKVSGAAGRNFGPESMEEIYPGRLEGTAVPFPQFDDQGRTTSFDFVETQPDMIRLTEGQHSKSVVAHEFRHRFHMIAEIEPPILVMIEAYQGRKLGVRVKGEELWNRILDGWYANDPDSWEGAVSLWRDYLSALQGKDTSRDTEPSITNEQASEDLALTIEKYREEIKEYEQIALDFGEEVGEPAVGEDSDLNLLGAAFMTDKEKRSSFLNRQGLYTRLRQLL